MVKKAMRTNVLTKMTGIFGVVAIAAFSLVSCDPASTDEGEDNVLVTDSVSTTDEDTSSVVVDDSDTTLMDSLGIEDVATEETDH